MTVREWWRRIVPSRTIPITRWRSEGSRWRTGPATFVVLVVGLWLFGTGEAMLVDAALGNAPWTVLAQGISVRSGLEIGVATFMTSVVVLLLWIPLRERPGLGTIANAIVIATALQVMVWVLPEPDGLGLRLIQVAIGILLVGIGSGLYLTTNLGPGPREGLMTGIHERTGIAVTPIRLSIEVVVLAAGWLLGGTVGIGTLAFALLIGPSVGYGLKLVGWLAGARAVAEEPDDGPHPELEA
ncbi:MAG: YczE/YyaS/YitT family protein [Actinomycetota bacterium]